MRMQASAFAPASVGNIGVGFDILGHSIAGPGDRVSVRRIEQRDVRIAAIRNAAIDLPFEAEKNTAGAALIAVGDHGPGIPASDRERVLKRFVRLEASRTRPGTGLGLSLVAAVARLHGGNIRLEDNVPGLRIVLVLPSRCGNGQ